MTDEPNEVVDNIPDDIIMSIVLDVRANGSIESSIEWKELGDLMAKVTGEVLYRLNRGMLSNDFLTVLSEYKKADIIPTSFYTNVCVEWNRYIDDESAPIVRPTQFVKMNMENNNL